MSDRSRQRTEVRDAHARQGARESSSRELRRMQAKAGLRPQTKAIIAAELRKRDGR